MGSRDIKNTQVKKKKKSDTKVSTAAPKVVMAQPERITKKKKPI